MKSVRFKEFQALLVHWCSKNDLLQSITFNLTQYHVNCFVYNEVIVLQESRTDLLLDTVPFNSDSISIEQFVLHYKQKCC